MKRITGILILIIFISCNRKKVEQIENFQHNEYVVEHQDSVDSTSFAYFLSLTKNESKITEYFVERFVHKALIDTNDIYQEFYGDSLPSYKLYNITVATIEISQYGVCLNKYLLTYNSNNEPVDFFELESACDQDLSSTTSEYSWSKIHGDSIIENVIVHIKAKNYSAYYLTDTVSFDEIETTQSSDYKYFLINKLGKITPLYLNKSYPGSERILTNEDLDTLNKQELRYLRNEFFARKGYIFKSKDLSEYFSTKSWYKPEFENVNEKLSVIEKYNIQLINNKEKNYAL